MESAECVNFSCVGMQEADVSTRDPTSNPVLHTVLFLCFMTGTPWETALACFMEGIEFSSPQSIQEEFSLQPPAGVASDHGPTSGEKGERDGMHNGAIQGGMLSTRRRVFLNVWLCRFEAFGTVNL